MYPKNQKIKEMVPTLILVSDIHLRDDKPRCRTDNFIDEQTLCLGFLCGLQVKYKCPVIHAGDLFNRWKPSPWLISYAIRYLPTEFYTIYGQHDLPDHNFDLRDKSGVHTLETAGRIKVLEGVHYGQKPEDFKIQTVFTKTRKILCWHHLTYTTPPFPGAEAGNAIATLKKYSQYDLIVTGDNHLSFYTRYQNRLLVNPGSFTRQKADQIDFQPRVALWYEEDNSIEWVELPIAEGVITRDYIEDKKEKDERIDFFLNRIIGDRFKRAAEAKSDSLLNKIEQVFAEKKVRKEIKDIVNKALNKE